MTATQVDGKKVLATEKIPTPLDSPEKRMFYISSLRLLLEDGTEVYGCAHCDYADPRLGVLRSHTIYRCENRPPELHRPTTERGRTRGRKSQEKEAVMDDEMDVSAILAALELEKAARSGGAQLAKAKEDIATLKKELLAEKQKNARLNGELRVIRQKLVELGILK